MTTSTEVQTTLPKWQDRSIALQGLPISLLEQTLERLSQRTNGSAALWFAQQIGSFSQ